MLSRKILNCEVIMIGVGIKITIGEETELASKSACKYGWNSLDMYYPQLKERDYFMELVSLPQKDS